MPGLRDILYSELTHAHAYMEESFFPRPSTPPLYFPGALNIPPPLTPGISSREHGRTQTVVVSVSDMPDSHTLFGNAELERGVLAQYWEVTSMLTTGASGRTNDSVATSIGYAKVSEDPSAWPDSRMVEYHQNGDIWLYGPGEPTCSRAASFEFGDVIGCGYVHPSTYFFTKNGELVDSVDGKYPFRLLFPALKIDRRNQSDDGTLISFQANFGHTYFHFDILAHLEGFYSRTPARILPANLPPEISDYILGHILQLVNEELPSAGAQRDLQRLSQVSRRWRDLCLRHRYTVLELSSIHDLIYASSVRPWFRHQEIIILEQRNRPWLHKMFSGPFLRRLYLPPDCTFEGLDADFPKRVPPRLSIPAVVRNTFANLNVLELSHCTFPSWLSFAKFVFAFPALTGLILGPGFSCRYTDPVQTLPQWLRFTQRPLCLSYTDGVSFDYLLLLFIAGKQRGTSPRVELPERDLVISRHDASVIRNLFKIIIKICPKADSFYYDAKSGTNCSLACWNSDITCQCISISFQRRGRLYVPVLLEFSYPTHGARLSHFTEINALLGKLTSSSDCGCRIDLTPQVGGRGGDGQSVISLQQDILAAMNQRHSAGLVTFECNGEEMSCASLSSGDFMYEPCPPFDQLADDRVRRAGGIITLTWDVSRVNLKTRIIPWVKTFKAAHVHEYDEYGENVAYVARVIDARTGNIELTMPANVERDVYSLRVAAPGPQLNTKPITRS